MKKLKILLLSILIILTCTGCTVEYNINITKNNIEETINVIDYQTNTRTKQTILKQYNMWYPTYVNYIPDGESIEIEDFSQKVDGIEYHSKSIIELNNGYKYTYKYTYPIEKYSNSYILASTYNETTIHKRSDSLVLKTSKDNFLCGYDYFEQAKVNITIDKDVYKLNYTNADYQKNNTYTWILDQNNCKDSEIILTLDTTNNLLNSSSNNSSSSLNSSSNSNNNSNNNNNLNNYLIYIILGIFILIIYFGYKWFLDFKERNNNID